MRLHPYRRERILSVSGALGSIATLAGAHHERLDSSGYRGCKRSSTAWSADAARAPPDRAGGDVCPCFAYESGLVALG